MEVLARRNDEGSDPMKLRRMLVIGALVAAPLVALSAPTTAGAVTPGEVLFQSAGASLKADGHTWLVSVQYTDAGTRPASARASP